MNFFSANLSICEEKFNPDLYNSIENQGFFIEEIVKNTPAYYSGLKKGDQIISLNNLPIKNYDEWSKIINEAENDDFTISVLRNNKILKFNLKSKLDKFEGRKIGFYSSKNKCFRDKNLSFYKDEEYHKCENEIDLKKYIYLKKLSKSSKYFEEFIFEKIDVTKRIGNRYSYYSNIFDLDKSKKYINEALKIANEIEKKILNKSLWYYKTFEADPSVILYRLAQLNLFLTESGNVGRSPNYSLFLDKLNSSEGLKILHSLSKKKHSVALHELGKIYLEGIYVKKDFDKAFNYFSESNKFGRNVANLDIADIYLLGLGNTSKNYKRAITHLKLGYIAPYYSGPENYFDLGVLYKYNRNPKNNKEYYLWLSNELLNYKSRLSLIRLGDFSRYHLNDYSKAYKWYYICSKIELENKNWDKNLFGGWQINYINECSENIIFLEKNILSKKDVSKTIFESKNWIKKYIK